MHKVLGRFLKAHREFSRRPDLTLDDLLNDDRLKKDFLAEVRSYLALFPHTQIFFGAVFVCWVGGGVCSFAVRSTRPSRYFEVSHLFVSVLLALRIRSRN